MANPDVLVYLQDILDAIMDVEQFFVDYPKRFDIFEKYYLRRSAVERKAEIMGEAMNRIKKADPSLVIPHARAIIDTRNRIIHAYDNVQPEFLWGLVIRHIPALKKDIECIISEYEHRLNIDNQNMREY